MVSGAVIPVDGGLMAKTGRPDFTSPEYLEAFARGS